MMNVVILSMRENHSIPLLLLRVNLAILKVSYLMPTKECFQVIYPLQTAPESGVRTDRFWKLNKAATLFIKGDVPDTAFNTLVRAAKHVEKEKPDAAVQFYQKEK